MTHQPPFWFEEPYTWEDGDVKMNDVVLEEANDRAPGALLVARHRNWKVSTAPAPG